MWIATLDAACSLSTRSVSTAALLAVIACASPHSLTRVGSPPAGATTIEVTNDRYDYVVVYIVHSGVRFELGVVPALSRRTFTPSASQLGSGVVLTLGEGPRGAAMDQVTLPLALLPGSRASWTVREKWIEQPVVR